VQQLVAEVVEFGKSSTDLAHKSLKTPRKTIFLVLLFETNLQFNFRKTEFYSPYFLSN
jgi:hypothetical protein